MDRRAEERKRILRHMLGMEGNPGRVWGYRNHYACGRDGHALSLLRGMEKEGLITEGTTTAKMIYFHATVAGCEFVGLNGVQIERAMERLS